MKHFDYMEKVWSVVQDNRKSNWFWLDINFKTMYIEVDVCLLKR